jgi:hypothetical protein
VNEKGATMKEVTVNKEALIAQITENRDAHREVFLRAQEVYREKVIALLDERLAAARKGDKIDLHFRLPVPEDYTHEYDMAISQLEWEEADTVTLDKTTFQELVLNEWRWAGAFAANTQSYVAG